MRALTVNISREMEGRTVKSVLMGELGLSSSLVARVKLRETGIVVNGVRVFTTMRLSQGDVLTVEIGDPPPALPIAPIPYPLDVLYEDDDLIAVNKAAAMAVHASTFVDEACTLGNALSAYLGALNSFHPINRLDKCTTGAMLVAKNGYMHERMRRILHTDDFYREYLAIAIGNVTPPSGTIDLPIARADDSPIKRTVSPLGAPSLTNYEVLSQSEGYSLVLLHPQTGRTHQLRLHMAAICHPLVGDWLYGQEAPSLIPRPALHSLTLAFTHPLSGEKIRLTAPVPQDMGKLIGDFGLVYHSNAT